VDSIEHGAYLDESAVEMLAHSHAVWTPTLVTIGNLIGCGRYPDDVLRPLYEYHCQMIRRCAELGGSIALGSDNGAYLVPHVRGTMDELRHLQHAIGENTLAVLAAGEEEIRKHFRHGEVGL